MIFNVIEVFRLSHTGKLENYLPMIKAAEFQKLPDHEQEILVFNEAKLVDFFING